MIQAAWQGWERMETVAQSRVKGAGSPLSAWDPEFITRGWKPSLGDQLQGQLTSLLACATITLSLLGAASATTPPGQVPGAGVRTRRLWGGGTQGRIKHPTASSLRTFIIQVIYFSQSAPESRLEFVFSLYTFMPLYFWIAIWLRQGMTTGSHEGSDPTSFYGRGESP